MASIKVNDVEVSQHAFYHITCGMRGPDNETVKVCWLIKVLGTAVVRYYFEKLFGIEVPDGCDVYSPERAKEIWEESSVATRNASAEYLGYWEPRLAWRSVHYYDHIYLALGYLEDLANAQYKENIAADIKDHIKFLRCIVMGDYYEKKGQQG